MKKFLICLLSIFMMASLAACGNSAKGESVSTAGALTRKLESKSDKTVNISEDIVLTEPIEIVGNKSIIGSGTITVSAEDREEAYMITLTDGAQLTVGGNATIDLSGLAGGIHVKEGTTLTLQDEAVVIGASVKSSNVLVEGTFKMNGGSLKEAKGHNVINKKETVIAGGEIKGSGSQYAAVYNEGTLTQNDGIITGAYNNVVSVSGSSFTWNKGEIKTSLDDAVIIEEGASIKITSADAKMTGVFAKGLVVNGEGVIDNVTMTDSMDSMIAVGVNGKLTINGGKVSDAGLHGIDNAGNLLVTGGTIHANYDSGVCNTGTFEMTGGTIMNNTNKGVLNKAGTAKIVSSTVVLSGNRFAVGNEEGAYFELAQAKLMQSTTTNIYAYGGEMYIHDIVLATSGSNNTRIVAADVVMEDVEIKGINKSGSRTMHGLLLEGGNVTAKNLTISNTTGNAIRNKGGNLQGENITIKDVKNVGISNTNQDETGRKGVINIKNVTVENVKNNNVLIEEGTCTLTNATLERCTTNNVKVTGGKLILKKSSVNGNIATASEKTHVVFMQGGTIEADNVKFQNTNGSILRVNGEEAVFNGKKITLKNAGVAGIEQTVGTIKIDGLTTKDINRNNVYMHKGTVELKNSTLGQVTNNSIRVLGAGTLVLTDVEIQGHVEGTKDDCHAIFPTNGTVIGTNLYIHDVAGVAVRVNGENAKVTLNGAEIDGAGYMAYRVGAGELNVTDTTTKNVKVSNVEMELKEGKLSMKNAVLCPTESNNIRVRNGAVALESVEIQGQIEGVPSDRHGLFVSKGTATAKNIKIFDAAGAGLRVNGEAEVTIDGVEIKDSGVYGIQVNEGKTVINGLTTSGVEKNNIHLYGNPKLTVTDATLGTTKNNNVRMENGTLVLDKVEIFGQPDGTADDIHGVFVTKGTLTAAGLDIKDSAGAALRVNGNAEISLNTVTIEKAGVYGLRINGGATDITNLTVAGVKKNNISVYSGEAKVSITDAVLGKTENNNVRLESGTTHFENVEIQGHVEGVEETVHGFFITKGTSTVKNLIIKDVKSSAIRVNGACEVTAEDIAILNAGQYGLWVNNGKMEISGLTTEEVASHTIFMVGPTNITLTDAELTSDGNSSYAIWSANKDGVLTGEDIRIKDVVNGIGGTAGTVILNHLSSAASYRNIWAQGLTVELNKAMMHPTSNNNVVADGTGTVLNLNDVQIFGNTGDNTGNHGLYVPNGTVTADKLVIQDTTGSAIRMNKATGKVTATDVIFKNLGTYGLQVNGGEIEITGLKTEGIPNHAVFIAGPVNVTLSDAELTSDGSDTYAIWSAHKDGELTGENVRIQNVVHGIGGSAGKITLNHSSSAATLQNVLLPADSTGIVTLNGTTLGTTSDNNIKVESGTVVINNSSINGTTKASTHGVFVNGGAVELNKVTIDGAVGAGIRVKKNTSVVTGNGVTVKKCNQGLWADTAGKCELTNLQLETSTGNNIALFGGSWVLNNVSVKGSNAAGLCVYGSANVTLNGAEVTGTTYDIYNTSSKLKLAGVIKADIYNDAAVTVSATASLVESAMKIDWPMDKLPTGMVGIQFANAADAEESKSGIALGEITAEKYAPYFDGDQMLLIDKNYAFYTIKNYSELKAALEHMEANDISAATITLAGDIVIPSTVTINTGRNITLVDDGTARTVLRDTTFNTKARGVLFDVSDNASLTFKSTGDDKNPKLTVDGNKENIVAENGNWAIVVGLGANTKVNVNEGVQFIDNSSTGAGCVIRMQAGTLTIDGGQFKNNTTTSNGGTLNIMTGVTATIKNATFSGNTGSYGGAIIIADGTQMTVEGCKFTNNTALGNGGAISTDNKTVGGNVFKNCTFTNNTANGEGGAINASTGVDLAFEDCTFTGNESKKATTTGVPTAWGNDIRLGGASNTTSISGKMVVEIFNRNASKLTVKGTLEEGSDVMVDWCVTEGASRVPSDKVGIVFDDDAAMNASQKYISLGGMMSPTYSLAYTNVKGILVAPIEVDTWNELKNAFTTISETTDKVGVVRLTGDITTSGTATVPANCNIAIEDDGTARTITRGTSYNVKARGVIFDISSGVTVTFRSTGNMDNPKLILDGNREKISATSGNWAIIDALANSKGVNIYEGVQIINNSSTGAGAAIRMEANSGALTIDGAQFKNNTSNKNHGGVINISTTKKAIVKNALFFGNKGNDGGVFTIGAGAQLEIQNSEFTENEATGSGGVFTIPNRGVNIIIQGCEFNSNTAGGNGGVAYSTNGTITCEDSVFVLNSAAVEGGVLFVDGGCSWTITNSQFGGTEKGKTSLGNTATKGGAIMIGTNGSVTLNVKEGSEVTPLFENNIATGSHGGGAIGVWRTGGLNVTGYTFKSNKVTGGEKSSDGNTYGGGAIAFVHGNAYSSPNATDERTTNLIDCNFISNSATNGGAIYSKIVRNLNVQNCDFKSNTAYNWGGACCLIGKGHESSFVSTSKNNVFESNSASGSIGACGGAIVASAGQTTKIDIEGYTFKQNSATYGKSIYIGQSALTLKTCSFDQAKTVAFEENATYTTDDNTKFEVTEE